MNASVAIFDSSGVSILAGLYWLLAFPRVLGVVDGPLLLTVFSGLGEESFNEG